MPKKLKLIIILIGLACVSLTRKGVDFHRRKLTPDITQIESDQALPFSDRYTVGQSFITEKNNLARITILLRESEKSNIPATPPETDITLTLVDKENDEIITQIDAPAKNIILENYLIYDFAPLAESAGREYYFYLEPKENEKEEPIPVLQTSYDAFSKGVLMVNHQPVEGDLAFRTYSLVEEEDAIFLLKATIGHAKADPIFFALYGLLVAVLPIIFCKLSQANEKN